MKLKRILLALLSLWFILPLAVQAAEVNSAQAKNHGSLTVVITGFKSDRGIARIAMYNSQQNFQAKDPHGLLAYQSASLTIHNHTAVWKLTNLPYGYYAIKLFQDEDKSGKLKRSLIGRPVEGVGFSQNPRLNHNPSFDETKFAINKAETEIKIKVVNF
ncbi:MAG: DUF2141 domain-containing protein [Proteobacteria bacterium]|nr:DUF2141 domain-containing protein [Pseudomonadota bacterium]